MDSRCKDIKLPCFNFFFTSPYPLPYYKMFLSILQVEERIANFYEKYLPADSTECKHALFLRLAR